MDSGQKITAMQTGSSGVYDDMLSLLPAADTGTDLKLHKLIPLAQPFSQQPQVRGMKGDLSPFKKQKENLVFKNKVT